MLCVRQLRIWQTKNYVSALFVVSYRGQRNLSAAKNQRFGFQIEIKKAKRLATSIVSIRQALELLAWH